MEILLQHKSFYPTKQIIIKKSLNSKIYSDNSNVQVGFEKLNNKTIIENSITNTQYFNNNPSISNNTKMSFHKPLRYSFDSASSIIKPQIKSFSQTSNEIFNIDLKKKAPSVNLQHHFKDIFENRPEINLKRKVHTNVSEEKAFEMRLREKRLKYTLYPSNHSDINRLFKLINMKDRNNNK